MKPGQIKSKNLVNRSAPKPSTTQESTTPIVNVPENAPDPKLEEVDEGMQPWHYGVIAGATTGIGIGAVVVGKVVSDRQRKKNAEQYKIRWEPGEII